MTLFSISRLAVYFLWTLGMRFYCSRSFSFCFSFSLLLCVFFSSLLLAFVMCMHHTTTITTMRVCEHIMAMSRSDPMLHISFSHSNDYALSLALSFSLFRL